jgi:hypothetical protein
MAEGGGSRKAGRERWREGSKDAEKPKRSDPKPCAFITCHYQIVIVLKLWSTVIVLYCFVDVTFWKTYVFQELSSTSNDFVQSVCHPSSSA